MSKVVTIPKDRNPFIVIVNGVEYKYPAGATIEVPDSVADVIEKYEGAKPKPDPNPAPGGNSGGSVQTDWNQKDETEPDFLKNKPFGDSPTGGDTLYWDGNTEGLVNVEGLIHKVSNAVPTKADFANGCIYQFKRIGFDDVNDIAFTAEEAQAMFLDDGSAFLQGVTIIPFDNYEAEGLLFREAGVYLAADDSMYVSFLTIPGYTGFPVTKKMEEKYLPGAVILYADAEAEGYLYSTNDTSDTSKRMTKAELLKVLQSGNAVYLHHLDFGYCLAVTFIDLGDSMGVGFAISGEYVNAYTAEYVPEG